MNYLKQLNLFGKIADIPYDIIGETDPTASTEARAGMGYFNMSSRVFFICVDDTPGARVWIPIASGGGGGGGSGETAVGIESVTPVTTTSESDGVNVYAINLTDGTSYHIEVKNGSAGKDYVLTDADKVDIAEIVETMIELPTKLSELENDAGYITVEDIPEMDAPTKVSELDNDVGFVTAEYVDKAVANAGGSGDCGGTTITKVSELENDTGYITVDDIPTVPEKLSDLMDDELHRTVTDEEKKRWNNSSSSESSASEIATVDEVKTYLSI